MQLKTEYNSQQSTRHFRHKEKILGQFWTPYEIAEFIVRLCTKFVSGNEFAMDPACGDGVFLESAKNVGFEKIIGIDIDDSVLAHANNEFKKNIIIADALKMKEFDNSADLVVGNPPFSSKYGKLVEKQILRKYDISRGKKAQSLEILFLEKFIRLAKKDGMIGIILPMGIFANTNLGYVRDYILKNIQLEVLISLPRSIFRSLHVKTTSKTIVMIGKRNNGGHKGKVLMSILSDISQLHKSSIDDLGGEFVELEDNVLYPEYYLNRLKLKADFRLDEIVEMKNGYAEYGEKRKFGANGKHLITAKNVTRYGIDYNRSKKIVTPGSSMDRESAYVFVEDIVFVRVGEGCMGRAAVIAEKEDEGIADDWIYILRKAGLFSNDISPYYIALYLQTPLIQKEIRSLSRGVGTPTIPRRELAKIPMLIDNELNEKAEEIYKRIRLLYKNGKKNEAESLLTQSLKNIERIILQQSSLVNEQKEFPNSQALLSTIRLI
ncbi:N-6 DNA methylase [bacterium]|nr:N-6 DNA methylase [bacterium]